MASQDRRSIQSTLFNSIEEIPAFVIVCNADGPIKAENFNMLRYIL